MVSIWAATRGWGIPPALVLTEEEERPECQLFLSTLDESPPAGLNRLYHWRQSVLLRLREGPQFSPTQFFQIALLAYWAK